MKWKKLALASVILGTIAGIAAPFTFDLYVFHASSAYSGRDFILRFSSPPKEENFLDAVIRKESLIEDPEKTIRQWREVRANGDALKIKIDDRKCLALKPFDPCESADTVFEDGTRIPGVWLTQPSTRKQVPISLLVLKYTGTSFILVTIISFIILAFIGFICQLLGVVLNRSKEVCGKSLPVIKKYWILILITVAVIAMGVCVLLYFSDTKASTIGSVAGACGGILAVVWFLAALKSQSEQLENQKNQFLVEFQTLREESRRNALIFAREVLKDAEEKALKQNPRLNNITDLVTGYLDFSYLKVVIESSDPHEVLEQFESWKNIEGPAITMIRGIKSASEIYFRAIGLKDIDYSKEPEDFVYIYSPHILKLPYFDSYNGIATILSQIMGRIQPGRKSAMLAFQVALAKTSAKGFMKEEKIREDIEARRASGLPIPKIAEDF
ncbi:MAG: hypothetical protein ACYSWP_05885 [Planctomycetota bacterium]|jgi:hypothetical protein